MNDQSRNQLEMILSKVRAETDTNVVLQKVRTCLSQFMKLLEQPHPIEMGLFRLMKIAQETIANRPERNCAIVVKIMGVLLDLSYQDWSNSSEITRLLKVAAKMMALLNPQEYDAIHQVVQRNGTALAYRFRESASFSVRYAVMSLIFEINPNNEPNKKRRESLLKSIVVALDKLANLQSMLEWNQINFQMKCRQYLHQLSNKKYHSSAVLSIKLNDLTLHPIKDGSYWLVEWNTDPNTVCFAGRKSTDENAPTIEAEIEFREIKSFSIIKGKDATKVKVSFKESLTLVDCSYSSVRETVMFIELLNADELAQLRCFLEFTLGACESVADISQEKVQNESFERQLTHEKVIDYDAVNSIQSDSTLNLSLDSKENNNLSPGPVPAVPSSLKPYALRPRNANNPGEPNTRPNQKKSPPVADPYDFCKQILQEDDNCKWKTINARIRNKRTTQNTNISVQTMVKSKKGSITGKQRTTFATFRQKLSSTPTKAVNRFVMETLDANHPEATNHNMDGYETLSSIASDEDNGSDELYSPYKDLTGSNATRGRKKRDTTAKKSADITRRSRGNSATALRTKPPRTSYISKIFAQTRESRPFNRYTRSVQNGNGNEQEKQQTEQCSYTVHKEQSFSQLSSDSSTILHAQIQQIAIDVFDTSSTNISTSEIPPKRGGDRVVQTNPSRGRRVSIEARQIHTQLEVHPSAVSTAICRVQKGLHQQQYDCEYDTELNPPQMVAHLANRTLNKERSLAQKLIEVQNATTAFVAKLKKEDNDLHTKLEQEEKECNALLEKYVQKRRNMCELLMQHKRSRVSYEEIDHQISKTDQQEQEIRTAAHQTLANLQQEESAVKRHGWAMYIEAFRRQMEEILRSACDP
ncbi:uncharacterized protein LOC126580863 [Anopheles aquasalis]|uniref:uncharacterized protein LOC126580863 n=1 Tax=Anopheles aquasalis TaxID=42839 RepID=UPI00215B65C0|nr:uncharacterized protein LOC126580863 [Anopheles aquasalis]